MRALAMLEPWTSDPALVWVVAAGALYAIGSRRLTRAGPTATQRWRAASFAAGLAAILLALDSPIDDLADKLLWVHMVQHILLLMVAPPLLALARPWNRMWHGFPLQLRRRVSGAVLHAPRWAPARRAASILAGAVASWLAFYLTLVAWHVPVAYDLSIRFPPD